ncbi:deleted in malignant brain tumors 1 protein-like [Clarias gariepinus]|uniref:deleted in malignant brain tumors 1 protein-like n=1 Tax=Clarias gariepinus TaxID=13013 RepID=UPI00234C9C34|nr:deleted in malignant brain tumors 1 protein-like [Clarias gariepinus]XP_053349077.1 deleted in malignant brain tumors 1 protein-like [Clarias gariepinus]XP_053349078.1 deleted in malignant brain tumors 1 protein-like [Clarias gariepinus]XP_053349079.1 deleted in malignant brain tumors 1 protein-like [Clarias gariepinus]XP_053349080.1 deleted in malignant brain tumors 1 protein-like [Clarias gariepinus]
MEMEVFKILVLLQALVLCQAKLYINQASTPCSWAITSAEENQSLDVAIFTKQSLLPLATRICQGLGCGKVYKLNENTAHGNASCLTGCSYHNNQLINCSKVHSIDCSILSGAVCDAPYIIPANNHCVWKITSPAPESAVILTPESLLRLSNEICQNFNCGEAFPQNNTKAPDNSSCLTDCIYHNSYLRNCSTVVRNDCTNMSEVICGKHEVRLSGGSHKCAGRVELWNAGQWGTVCDDEWDKQDADVVCAQLNCGYAISVNGQDGPYTQGKGRILMDELNCTGKERSLWECPAVREGHDCGHKEDAGVVCSEYKALRLTGGLDRCSGRVEIHRNGSWGTVCNECWDKQEASMACSMLGCGTAKKFEAFETHFTHTNGSLWYYFCKGGHKTLWECLEIETSKVSHLQQTCRNSMAAGVICNNSLGLPVPTTPVVSTTTVTTMQPNPDALTMIWTPELLGCIILSCILLIAILSNIIMCCCSKKKRKALEVQQRFASLQTNAAAEENNYRDSIHLVKVTNNDTDAAPPIPPQIWTQSSVESTSYDTDYEANDSAPSGDFTLSTFRNSMRHNADGRPPAVKGPHLQMVTEEDTSAGVQGYLQAPFDTFQRLSATPSADSFDTSSTSSGEVYENTGHNTADLYMENYEHPGEIISDLPLGVSGESINPSGGEDSPIYSPVSADVDFISHDTDDHGESDDYDDVVGYPQTPLMY